MSIVLVLIVAGSILLIVISGFVLKSVYYSIHYGSIIRRKKESLQKKKDDLLNKLMDLKTPIDEMEEITGLDVQALQSRLDEGTLLPDQVLHAYQAKSLLMDQELNFITDLNPYAEMDTVAFSKGGLLRGVPISIKDTFFLRGCDTTCGVPSFCFRPSDRDCTLVEGLRAQGGVPFVITNMAQTGKSIECSNPIFGRTLNPHNKTRSSGGSSGGEGAILGSGASILGVGNDIGGSVRIPAAYCGVFALKPTADRVTRRRNKILYANQDMVQSAVGPMTRTFPDLVVLFRALVSEAFFLRDPYCPPLSFQEHLFQSKRPLRIGFYCSLGPSQVTPIPAVSRAVLQAKSALESAGHTVLEFQVPQPDQDMYSLFLQCLFTDGGHGFLHEFVRNNPVEPLLLGIYWALKLPDFLKKVVSYLIYPFNKRDSKMIFAVSGASSVYDVWRLKGSLKKYQEKVVSSMEALDLDGLIGPVSPITAPLCNGSRAVIEVMIYTALYNLLDFPAGSVPVTKVNKNDMKEFLSSYPRDSATHRTILDLEKDNLNMPVAVQCMSLPWREETCLRMMGDIDNNLH